MVTKTRTIAAQLGVTQHRIVYSPALVGWTVIALMIPSASRTHRAIRTSHSCAERALRMHHPVTAHAPREAAVNVLLANHASPVRLAGLQSRSSPQINKSLRRGPFSAARALGMRPHPVNMHALREYTRLHTVALFNFRYSHAHEFYFASGSSDDCPGDLLCFAGTSCEASESFFCGASFEAAATSCTIPCKNGLSSDCPIGEKCYGYTPCTSSNTFYCGLTFEEASSTCDQPCPTGEDSECSGSATCQKYTTCADGVSSISTEKHDVNSDSFFCGFSFQDASDSCEVACPSGTTSECGDGQECFPHTTCSKKNPETFFCGTTLSDANLSCTHSCSSSNDCPDGESCFAYTTCVVPKDDHQPDGELVNVNVSSDSNTEEESITTSVTNTEDESMTSFSSEIPSESYYCGLSYEDASTTCSIPCPDRDSSKCPELQQCYAYTPCAKPESFFCGDNIDDANESCAVPCRSGSSSSCPSGQSCYAYTECEVSSTNAPSTSRPTTRSPTSYPTLRVRPSVLLDFYHIIMIYASYVFFPFHQPTTAQPTLKVRILHLHVSSLIVPQIKADLFCFLV